MAITCATISCGLRLRFKPIRPVAQNEHLSAQPTWLEMQNVSRRGVRMLTLSTRAPSARRSTNLCVLPSGLVCTEAVSGSAKSQMAGSERRNVSGRLVMSSGSRTRFW